MNLGDGRVNDLILRGEVAQLVLSPERKRKVA